LDLDLLKEIQELAVFRFAGDLDTDLILGIRLTLSGCFSKKEKEKRSTLPDITEHRGFEQHTYPIIS
jgi:hypothetical protein